LFGKFFFEFSLIFLFLQAHLALYCFANSQISTALKLLYRARYLATIVCGDNHPDIALMDVRIGVFLVEF
jgi:protein TIF31